ncbi:MAG: hypothetical protein AAGE01_22325, partial [Pseudomonadota bacterium]
MNVRRLLALFGLLLSGGAMAQVELPLDTNVRFDVGPVASEQETLVFQGLFFRTPPNTARFSMEVFDASGFSGVT